LWGKGEEEACGHGWWGSGRRRAIHDHYAATAPAAELAF